MALAERKVSPRLGVKKPLKKVDAPQETQLRGLRANVLRIPYSAEHAEYPVQGPATRTCDGYHSWISQ